jgi:hypothetical protein
MSLTATQQAEADILQSAIAGPPAASQAIQNAFVAFINSLNPWWKPSISVATAFAARIGWSVADLLGERRAVGEAGAPAIPPCDGTEADAMLYAAFSFEPYGWRTFNWTAGRDAARATADRLSDALTSADAEAIFQGSSTKTMDYAIWLCMLGHNAGNAYGPNHQIDDPQWKTIAQALAVAPTVPLPVPVPVVVPPGPPAPGPGLPPGIAGASSFHKKIF